MRKHFSQRRGTAPPVRLDEASSGRWFAGWRRRPRGPSGEGSVREVALARSGLLCEGWRRHGLVGPAEVPGTRRR